MMIKNNPILKVAVPTYFLAEYEIKERGILLE